MWIAKIQADSKGTLIGTKAEKYKIDLFGFPLSYYYEKNCIVLHIAGTLIGKAEDKKNFVKELKKEKRIINFELNGDFVIGVMKDPLHMKYLYNKNIIHIAPVVISDKGYAIYTLGSFKKEALSGVIKILEKNYNGKLISIENKKVKSISIVKIHPDLTDKQKQAIELAIKHGYYHSPRKIDVKKLAKLAGLSFSTFQVHLRKAEEKLIPYFFE